MCRGTGLLYNNVHTGSNQFPGVHVEYSGGKRTTCSRFYVFSGKGDNKLHLQGIRSVSGGLILEESIDPVGEFKSNRRKHERNIINRKGPGEELLGTDYVFTFISA